MVPPLSLSLVCGLSYSSPSPLSRQGVWAELLGFGDFYYELGVQLAEACLATRAHNGGLMELSALLRYVQRRRGSGSETISEDDVVGCTGPMVGFADMVPQASMEGEIRELRSLVSPSPGNLNTSITIINTPADTSSL